MLKYSPILCAFCTLLLLISFDSIGQKMEYKYDPSGDRIAKIIYIDPNDPDSDFEPDGVNSNSRIKNPDSFTDNVDDIIIKIYPNPTPNKIFIELPPETQINNLNIRIIDINGNIIHETNRVLLRNEFNFENYSDGTYFLQLIGNKNNSNWTIIKN